MPQSSPRNHRNNPYTLDRMFAQVHHSAAGTFWRSRTELGALATVTASGWELETMVTLGWTLIVFGLVAMTALAVPWTRQLVVRRAWCVISRHRIQRVCFETRMHTRSGRLPLVVRITPTEVGERALIWCRAGICADDFTAHAPEIAAACLARQARVEGSSDMDLISTSWSCARCGAAYISTPPEHGLCDQCLADLEALARLAPVAAQPCPACGGPVCADCGTALILLVPGGMSIHERAGEVSGDGG